VNLKGIGAAAKLMRTYPNTLAKNTIKGITLPNGGIIIPSCEKPNSLDK
jgi:hypothetical protein